MLVKTQEVMYWNQIWVQMLYVEQRISAMHLRVHLRLLALQVSELLLCVHCALQQRVQDPPTQGVCGW